MAPLLDAAVIAALTKGSADVLVDQISESPATALAYLPKRIQAEFKTKKSHALLVALFAELVSKCDEKQTGFVVFSIFTECFIDLLSLATDAKLSKSVVKVLKDVVLANKHKPCVFSILEPLLEAIENPPKKQWKIKCAGLEVLDATLIPAFDNGSKKQLLNLKLADMVRILVECCKEPRAEIKKCSTAILQTIGEQLVKCMEIREIAPKILNCLTNFGNMNLARDTLYLMANTTFLSYVDAASFALIFPIVERAMKERQFDSKKNGIMIIGAAVVLIEDPEILTSYLPALLPILTEDLAIDPTFEIQREAAKSLGCLAKNMPDTLFEKKLLPWALDKMQSSGADGDLHQSENERAGAAHSLSEMMQCIDSLPDYKDYLEEVLREVVMPRCLGKAENEDYCNAYFESDTTTFGSPAVKPRSQSTPVCKRSGAFGLLEFLCKTDCFAKAAKSYGLSFLLQGLHDESVIVTAAAFQCASTLMNEYAGLEAHCFVHPLADAVLSFEGPAKAQAMLLFRKAVEKVSESRKYGEDIMTMSCASMDTRLVMVVLLQICAVVDEPEVRRNTKKLIAEQVQSEKKMKKDTQEQLAGSLKAMATLSTNPGKKTMCKYVLDGLKANGDIDQAAYDAADVAKSVLREYVWTSDAVFIAAFGKAELSEVSPSRRQQKPEGGEGVSNAIKVHHHECAWTDLSGRVAARFADEKLQQHLMTFVDANESDKNLFATEAFTKDFFSALQKGFETCVLESYEAVMCQEKLEEALYGFFPAAAYKSAEFDALFLAAVFTGYNPPELRKMKDDADTNLLCRVENLMLMYGGGHLLLKDTDFEMRKGKRYGVLGRNGTGKTTLMNLIASGGVPQIPKSMTCIHVKPEVLEKFMSTNCRAFLKRERTDATEQELDEILENVLFPRNLWKSTIAELSGGWRMRLLIAEAMLKKADVLLLDEPTNHLDKAAVTWLCEYLVNLNQSAIMVISHDPFFLNRVCTNIINYNNKKLVYYEGNFDDFTKRMNINADDAAALLSGEAGVGENGIERANDDQTPKTQEDDQTDMSAMASPAPSEVDDEEEDATPSSASSAGGLTSKLGDAASSSGSLASMGTSEGTPAAGQAPDRKAKIVFPVPGRVKGLTSLVKPVLEVKDLTWAYNEEGGDVLQGINQKITMNSRVHIKGVNGAGKSTFMNLVCGEVHPNASALSQAGSVERHRNCRLAYMAQQHMHHMKDFMNSSPYIYFQKRFQAGFDAALQERLLSPANEEEYQDRVRRAKEHGKYGNMVRNLCGRQIRGKEPWYEVQWENLPDSRTNTWTNMNGLRDLGCESFALAYDDREASKETIGERPLSQREICRHLEQFGITEELALNRTIGMFSAGQKSKVSLAAAFWIKPHVIALDEPTNYIDMETLEALTVALQRFKGGVICISHCAEFAERVCNETWFLEKGNVTVTKKKDEKKLKN